MYGEDMSIKYLCKSGLLSVLNILFMIGIFSQPSVAEEGQVNFGKSELSIFSAGHKYKFDVEVADTDEQRARGLMFRKEMAQQNGMLFFFRENQKVIMWMKNTFIPLDIIFIDQKGVIVHIAKSTVPHSLDYISSYQPVISAFEVNAGVTDRFGIRIGDIIEHPFFTSPSE